MVTSDIDASDLDIPLMAKLVYELYPYDALEFEINAIQKLLEFLTDLFSNTDLFQRERMTQILKLQAITKFCQYAENLAAIAISFKTTFDNERQEMVGIFDKLTKYGEGEIVDFYAHIGNRKPEYVAKFYGYPPLDLQPEATKKFLELSCMNMRETMINIGQMYHELRSLYNAYKHGYRVLFSKDNTLEDTYPFIDYNGKQKFTQVNKDAFNRILSISHNCRDILEHIYRQHRIRNEYERSGGKEGELQVNLFLKGTDPHPSEGNLYLMYPTRGNRLIQEKWEGDKIYKLFEEELEKHDKGKIVAIDVDAEEIIAKDYNKENVLYKVRNASHSGRIHLRRVSRPGSTGIEIY